MSKSDPEVELQNFISVGGAYAQQRDTRDVMGTVKGPQVRAVKIKGRTAVYVSREDLSAGLVGEAVDGIVGYQPSVATSIMRNLLMYAGFGDKTEVVTVASTTKPTRIVAAKPTTRSARAKQRADSKAATKPAAK